MRLQSFLSSSHPLYVLYSHVPITQAIYMYIYRQLRMPQLPYSCVLAMQVAASEETVPGCDEYSGCPCATAAKVRGMGTYVEWMGEEGEGEYTIFTSLRSNVVCLQYAHQTNCHSSLIPNCSSLYVHPSLWFLFPFLMPGII